MSQQENIELEQPGHVIQDVSGLDEIQKALQEIERLDSNNSEDLKEVKEAGSEKESEENSDEDSNESFGEDSIETETNEESKPRKKKDKTLWKAQRQKYKALSERDELLEENKRLKEMLDESINSEAYHYSKNAYGDLERAKELKKRAIEEGDIDLVMDADIAMTKAVQNINELERWATSEEQKAAQNYKTTNNNAQQQEQAFGYKEQEMVRDWLDEHPYLEPTSEQYNPQLANKVANYAQTIENQLTANNRRDLLFSDEYFDAIDEYVGSLRKEESRSKKIDSVAPVGGVTKNYNSVTKSKSGPSKVILTADERRMCHNAGLDEKDWLKYKLEMKD